MNIPPPRRASYHQNQFSLRPPRGGFVVHEPKNPPMSVLDRLLGRSPQASLTPLPDQYPHDIPLAQMIDAALFDGQIYPQQTMTSGRINVAPDFLGLVRGAYKANPIVWACIDRRQALFSQARLCWQQVRDGKPGDLFGTHELAILEEPWPGAVTADMLSLAEVSVSTSGNNFYARTPDNPDRIQWLRPDWVSVVFGSDQEDDDPYDAWKLGAGLLGYAYQPGGPGSGRDPVLLYPEEVAHYMPVPDPEAPWRGLSWLTPLLREIAADRQMTDHKSKYLEGGATPNLAIKLDVNDMATFNEWVAEFRAGREGDRGNPYRTLFLASVATPIALGNDMREVDFRAIQGAGEVRITAAAGMHPSVLAISEGLQGSSLNAGNLQAAQRWWADNSIRPLWGNFAASMQRIVPPPERSRLWYDDSQIPALQQDAADKAEIQQTQAATIGSYIINGFVPDSAVKAVLANDLNLLKHTGLLSVQLLPGDGSGADHTSNGNGNGNGSAPALNGNGNGNGSAHNLAGLIAPPGVTFNERAITIEPPPAATVNVQPPNVHVDVHNDGPTTSSKRTVTFSDGRTATIEEDTDQ